MPSFEVFLFWPLCLLTVVAAAGCTLARNLLYAALYLGVGLLGVSSLYFFLQAEYLAVVQLVVYVGGILVLVLFAVMFSRDILGKTQRTALPVRIFGALTFLVVIAAALRLAYETAVAGASGDPAGALQLVRSTPESFQGNIATSAPIQLGDLLMGPYLVPFLAIAMLLTAALLGALALVRKESPSFDDATIEDDGAPAQSASIVRAEASH